MILEQNLLHDDFQHSYLVASILTLWNTLKDNGLEEEKALPIVESYFYSQSMLLDQYGLERDGVVLYPGLFFSTDRELTERTIVYMPSAEVNMNQTEYVSMIVLGLQEPELLDSLPFEIISKFDEEP